jgi:hypothetical protein
LERVETVGREGDLANSDVAGKHTVERARQS